MVFYYFIGYIYTVLWLLTLNTYFYLVNLCHMSMTQYCLNFYANRTALKKNCSSRSFHRNRTSAIKTFYLSATRSANYIIPTIRFQPLPQQRLYAFLPSQHFELKSVLGIKKNLQHLQQRPRDHFSKALVFFNRRGSVEREKERKFLRNRISYHSAAYKISSQYRTTTTIGSFSFLYSRSL